MSWWHWWLLAGVPWAVFASVTSRQKYGAYAWGNMVWVVGGPLGLLFLGLAYYARKP